MKKLFISAPMNGRTKENIQKSFKQLKDIAEAMFGEELEVIDTWISEEPGSGTKNPAVWYLGKSIELLSKADYFIGISYCGRFNGCNAELEIARAYGIRSAIVSMFEIDCFKDVVEVIRNSADVKITEN
jgi:hypothetical protein